MIRIIPLQILKSHYHRCEKCNDKKQNEVPEGIGSQPVSQLLSRNLSVFGPF